MRTTQMATFQNLVTSGSLKPCLSGGYEYGTWLRYLEFRRVLTGAYADALL